MSEKMGEQTKRQERIDRILDAASELILRWGYKKTTVDDIARLAGVAKGTIYLHWKSREHLFFALLARENVKLSTEIQEALAREPEGVTLHSMAKHMILSLAHNPLMYAVVKKDHELLGDLLEGPYRELDIRKQMDIYYRFLEYMREQGLIRSDQSLEEQTAMLIAIIMGYQFVDDYLLPEFRISNERRADLAAETVQRTFELRDPDAQEKQVSAVSFAELVQSLGSFQVQMSGEIEEQSE